MEPRPRPEEALSLTAEEAIRTAMQIERRKIIMSARLDGQTSVTDEHILAAASSGHCVEASARTVDFLTKNFPALFTKLFLFNGDAYSEAFTRLSDEMDQHTCMIAETAKGLWHAGSPANYRENSGYDRYAEVLTSPDVAGLIQQIQTTEGGTWPSAEDLRAHLSGYESPRSKPERPEYITIFTITPMISVPKNSPFRSMAQMKRYPLDYPNTGNVFTRRGR